MIIKLIHKITKQPLKIETEHNDPDNAISIEYEGHPVTVSAFIRNTKHRYGYYGQIFHLENTTNLDLQKIAYELPEFEVLSIEPLIEARPLPKDTMT